MTVKIASKEEYMSKFISWNIDSLNAALTSDSPRAGSVPGLSCRVGQLGTAGQKGLCGDNDSL